MTRAEGVAVHACIVVPVYNHEEAIAGTLASLRPHGLRAYLVDDGSRPSCAAELDRRVAAQPDWLRLIRLPQNQGKGAAVIAGFAAAAADGYTHAVQVDADGQHDAADLPKLLALAHADPQALITGIPIYDASVPRARLYGRYLTHVWVWINTLSLQIRDSMLGFRVYPLTATLRICRSQHVGKRMDFDTEIMVRLYWDGVSVHSLPTRVRYPADGVSHFDVWRDNLRISRMHARLFFGMLWRAPRLLLRHLQRQPHAR